MKVPVAALEATLGQRETQRLVDYSRGLAEARREPRALVELRPTPPDRVAAAIADDGERIFAQRPTLTFPGYR